MRTRTVWLARRLAAMTPAEVAYRAAQAARRRVDARRRFAPPRLAPPRDLFAGLSEGVRALGPLAAWRDAYGMARAGRFAWFGAAWPGGMPDWHLEPVSGRRWPMGFGPAIDYRHANGFGDVKCTWELNRLQYLQPIAALACATGEAGPAELVRAHVADWIARNPPWLGINWASGIELGLRAVSLAMVAQLVPLGEALGRSLAASLAAHGTMLARYPSRYSSANNHAVAEALGLLAVGRAIPEHPRAAAWAAGGARALWRLADELVLPDGAGAEQALAYHCFTLEMLWVAGRIAPGPDLSRAAGFLRAITDAGGHAPRIGDDDEARVVWSPPGPEFYARDMVAVLGGAPVAAVPPHLRHALSGPPRAPAPGADGVAHSADGGITVLRRDGMLMAFDHGPLGHLSIAAHGHADALAVWLHVDGAPVIVDAGTFRYHGAGASRDALRGTAAHNTLTVADADQSAIAGPFNWSRKARARVAARDDAGVVAEHDGYARRFGCVHRRGVRMDGARIVVTDRLIGTRGPWPVTAGFLIAPGLPVTGGDGVWRIGGRLTLRAAGPLRGVVVDAAFSPAMGVMARTRRLEFRGALGADEAMTFTFAQGDAG